MHGFTDITEAIKLAKSQARDPHGRFAGSLGGPSKEHLTHDAMSKGTAASQLSRTAKMNSEAAEFTEHKRNHKEAQESHEAAGKAHNLAAYAHQKIGNHVAARKHGDTQKEHQAQARWHAARAY